MLETKVITIGGNTFYVRLSFRAMLHFEKMSGNSLSFETTEDAVMLFYCACQAGAFREGKEMHGYEEFLNLIDDYPEAIAQIYDVLTGEVAKKKQKGSHQ